MARAAPACPDVAVRAAAMPESNMHKVHGDDPDDQPSRFATVFVFVTITLMTVLNAVLITYGVRALFKWVAG